MEFCNGWPHNGCFEGIHCSAKAISIKLWSGQTALGILKSSPITFGNSVTQCNSRGIFRVGAPHWCCANANCLELFNQVEHTACSIVIDSSDNADSVQISDWRLVLGVLRSSIAEALHSEWNLTMAGPHGAIGSHQLLRQCSVGGISTGQTTGWFAIIQCLDDANRVAFSHGWPHCGHPLCRQCQPHGVMQRAAQIGCPEAAIAWGCKFRRGTETGCFQGTYCSNLSPNRRLHLNLHLNLSHAHLWGRTVRCMKSWPFSTTDSHGICFVWSDACHGSQGPEFCTRDAVLNGSCTLL